MHIVNNRSDLSKRANAYGYFSLVLLTSFKVITIGISFINEEKNGSMLCPFIDILI